MSSASNPFGDALPQQQGPRPQIVKPVPPKPRPRGLLWVAVAVAVIAGAAVYVSRNRVAQKESGSGSGAAVLRTAVVAMGDVQRTLRVSGTISAERFAAITAPRLLGNRNSQAGNRVSSRGTSYGPSSGSASTSGSG